MRRGAVRVLARRLHIALNSAADPLVSGPRLAMVKRSAILLSLLLAASSLAAAAAWASGMAGAWVSIALALASLAAALLPSLWRAVYSSLLEREAPLVLAYILPYSPVAPTVVDLMLSTLRSRSLRWVKEEAMRLKMLLDFGLDPERAAAVLAETTPSRTLRGLLADYIAAQRLGTPKSRLSMSIVESTISAVKSQWAGYMKTSQALGEIALTVIAASLILAPLAAMTSPPAAQALVAAAAVSSLAFSAVIIMLRPPLGDGRQSTPLFLASYAAPPALSATAFLLGVEASLALGAVLMVVLEAASAAASRREAAALASLREAAARARVGLEFEESLKRSSDAAGPIVEAILDAARMAGRTGVSRALDAIHSTIVEARSLASATRPAALLLGAATSLAPAVSILLLRVVESAQSSWAGSPPFWQPPGYQGLEAAIVAVAPLVTLPAAALHRPWRPSIAYSLVALAGVAAAGVLAVVLIA